MTDIADKVDAALAQSQSNGGGISQLNAKLDTLISAVQAQAAPQPATVDLQPVLDAVAAVSAKLESTPPAPPAAG